MYIALTLLLALDVFLLVRLRAEMKTAERYQRAMSESDLTVAILEAIKEKGWETVIHQNYKGGWSAYAMRSRNNISQSTATVQDESLVDVVKQLQKATKTTLHFGSSIWTTNHE